MTKTQRIASASVVAIVGLILAVAVALRSGSDSTALSSDDVATVNRLLAEGQAQRINGQVARAEETFAKILKIDDTNALARFNLGQLLKNRNDFLGAAKQFGKILTTRPDYVEARVEYVVCLQRGDKVDDAIKVLRAAVIEYPAEAKYKVLLGRLLVSQGNFDEGDRLVGAGLRIDPSLENWNP